MFAALPALILALIAQPAPSVMAEPDFSWLAGHWRSEASGRVSEEIWMEPEGGLMTGMGRSLRDGRATGFEFAYITTGEDAAYFAQPGGRPATRFALVSHQGSRAVFENPDHDFPQRIEYSREGNVLTATISSLDRSREVSWSWTRRE